MIFDISDFGFSYYILTMAVSQKKLEFHCDIAEERLDKYLVSRLQDYSRSQVQELIKKGLVTVNSSAVKAGYSLKKYDLIRVNLPSPSPVGLEPQPIPLKIIYNDKDIIVLDKSAGLVVHPAPGHPDRTLVNALLSRFPELSKEDETQRPGIVHRLDKDTSGLMIVAMNPGARENLMAQMKGREITKKYYALIQGHLSPKKGAIEAPVGRDPSHRQKMAVVSKGKYARTGYKIIGHYGTNTLVEATLETGRTHQIRLHFAAIGHPVTGDATYGKPSSGLKRQFLHSFYLKFHHPTTGKEMEFNSPLPEELQDYLGSISEES